MNLKGEEQNTKCHICSGKSGFSFNKDNHAVYECSECGLFFIHPQPTKDFLEKEVYTGSYQKNKNLNLSEVKLSKDKLKVISYIKNNIPSGRKVLDIGCSNGELLFNIKKEGYDCYGVELSFYTYKIAKDNGLNVFNGTIEEAGFEEGFFDVIFLGDVIEHVNNPHSFLAECTKVLKKGGVVIISTPNMDCFWAKSTLTLMRLFGIPWSLTTPPHHLFQFSFSNLNLLAEKNDLVLSSNWFNYPPALKYEIGQTHVWGNFKRKKSLKNFLRFVFGIIFYSIFYFVNKITKPSRKKDCGMVCVYKNNCE